MAATIRQLSSPGFMFLRIDFIRAILSIVIGLGVGLILLAYCLNNDLAVIKQILTDILDEIRILA